MDCLPVSKLPEGPEWTYEIKLEVVRSAGRTTFYSRMQNVLRRVPRGQHGPDELYELFRAETADR
jgi:hypothetical protein